MAVEPTVVPKLIESVNNTLENASEAAGEIITSLPIWLSKLLLAALAVVLGAMVIRFGRKLINRLVQGRKGSTVRSPGQRETLRSLVISVFNYTMYFILITVVLGIFGVNVTSMIAVAGSGRHRDRLRGADVGQGCNLWDFSMDGGKHHGWRHRGGQRPFR